MRSFKIPYRNRTNGANDIEITFNGRSTSRQHIYSLEGKLDPNSCEPEFRRDCYEAYLEWIEDQDFIFGCMYNLWDIEILRLLKKRMFALIIINSNEGLTKETQKEYSSMRFSMLKVIEKFPDFLTMTEDETELDLINMAILWENFISGISVFPEQKRGADKFPYLMHHKFLVGLKIGRSTGNYTTSASAIYGSFNLSTGATKNIDSVLIFRENDKLCERLIQETFLTFCSSIPWREYCKDGGERWNQEIKREYIKKEPLD